MLNDDLMITQETSSAWWEILSRHLRVHSLHSVRRWRIWDDTHFRMILNYLFHAHCALCSVHSIEFTRNFGNCKQQNKSPIHAFLTRAFCCMTVMSRAIGISRRQYDSAANVRTCELPVLLMSKTEYVLWFPRKKFVETKIYFVRNQWLPKPNRNSK